MKRRVQEEEANPIENKIKKLLDFYFNFYNYGKDRNLFDDLVPDNQHDRKALSDDVTHIKYLIKNEAHPIRFKRTHKKAIKKTIQEIPLLEILIKTLKRDTDEDHQQDEEEADEAAAREHAVAQKSVQFHNLPPNEHAKRMYKRINKAQIDFIQSNLGDVTNLHPEHLRSATTQAAHEPPPGNNVVVPPPPPPPSPPPSPSPPTATHMSSQRRSRRRRQSNDMWLVNEMLQGAERAAASGAPSTGDRANWHPKKGGRKKKSTRRTRRKRINRSSKS